MESKVAVIKDEQVECPPGFTPKSQIRSDGAVAVASSPTAGAIDGSDQLDAFTPIESSSLPTQNRIYSLMQQCSSSAKTVENCTNRTRGTGVSPSYEPLRYPSRNRGPAPSAQAHGSDSRERRCELANDIQQIDAVGTKRLCQEKRDEGTWTRQFRSNLKRTVEFFEGVRLRQEHLDCLKKTPFYHLVLPFAKKRITIASVKGTQIGTKQLLMSYDKQRKAFNLGGKNITITPEECDLIFGIKSGTKKVVDKRASLRDSSLAQRKFSNYDRLKLRFLKEQLLKYLHSNTQQDIEDTVRIVILHLLSTVFFTTSGEVVNLWMFKICEDLDRLREYNWGKHIVDFFMKSVHKKEAEEVKGCTTLLLYWICERTTLVNSSREDTFPRFRKWHLHNLKSALRCTAFKDILPEQVSDVPIRKTAMEHAILSGQQEYITDDDDEMVAEGEDSNSDASQGDNASSDDQNHNNDRAFDDTAELDAPIATTYNLGSSRSKRRRPVQLDDECNDGYIPLASWIVLFKKIKEQKALVSELEQKLAAATKDAESWRIKAEQFESENIQLQAKFDDMLSIELERGNNLNVEVQKLKAENEKLKANITILETRNKGLEAKTKLGSQLRTFQKNDSCVGKIVQTHDDNEETRFDISLAKVPDLISGIEIVGNVDRHEDRINEGIDLKILQHVSNALNYTAESQIPVDDREVKSRFSNTDKNLVNTLKAINEKYGDITRDCSLESDSMKIFVLLGVCKVVQDLQKKQIKDLDVGTLESCFTSVRDAENMKVNVRWLHNRLDEIKDVVRLNDEAKGLVDERNIRLENMERLKSEIRDFEDQMAHEAVLVEQLSREISAQTSKFSQLQHMYVLDGLV